MSSEQTPRPHAELIKAWADGAKIQVLVGDEWEDCCSPTWFEANKYRIKPEESEKTEKWKPNVGDVYFYTTIYGNVNPTEWKKDDAFDNVQYEHGNCFRTHYEAEAAAERVKAALKGEEPKGEKVALLHPYLNGKPVSDGELALIRAIRKARVISTWEQNSAVLVYESAGEIVSRSGIVAFLTDGTNSDDDVIREALNKISREQDAEQEDEDE